MSSCGTSKLSQTLRASLPPMGMMARAMMKFLLQWAINSPSTFITQSFASEHWLHTGKMTIGERLRSALLMLASAPKGSNSGGYGTTKPAVATADANIGMRFETVALSLC